ncbi:hypothetical protein GGR92_004829 [Spirosoma lacussanchae]|uniref:hypothetical protein n=1 Tax=Spirosoma lacussanchae TaxID=1884249 RepID=UPI0011080F03|nr:hypothetical protein [Spirosoma lacussanchae]
MSNTITEQGNALEALEENTQAFRRAYKRLNPGERKDEQRAFCRQYRISPVAFRARLSGNTRVSDTELAWLEKRVNSYFSN